jgi:hypothetical protein
MPESLSLVPAGPAPGLRLLWSAVRGVVMCTYLTEKVSISGSGKGPSGWFTVTDASVYFDHPVHAQAEHTLNIDFLDPDAGPSARVAVELTAESARALAKAIQATLDAVPPGLAS